MADNKTFKDGLAASYTHALEDIGSVWYTRMVGAAAENAAATGSPVLAGGRYDASARTLGDGDAGAVALNSAGHILVDMGPNNDVTIGSSGIADNFARQLGTVKLANSAGANIDPIPASSLFRSIDLDESEEEVKATAAKVYWVHAINMTAATLYLKFYNATAASVTVGTTTPVLTFPIPTQGDTNGAGFAFSFGGFGADFSTALTVACTTGLADADTGAPAANACIVNIGYV